MQKVLEYLSPQKVVGFLFVVALIIHSESMDLFPFFSHGTIKVSFLLLLPVFRD